MTEPVRAKLVLVFALVTALAPLTAAATSFQFNLRIYDPAHAVKAQVTGAEVLRSSVKVARDPTTGSGVLVIPLTKRGDAELAALTRGLAHRGARVRRNLPFVTEIDGRVQRNFVDYKAFPNGINPGGAIEMTGLKLATARKLAALIRQG